jgi:glycosyltransferase involved in cell wall biosynthesis
MADGRALLSVVVPVHDEESVLEAFHGRLAAVLDGLDCDAEVVYVNDGSGDASLARMQQLRAGDDRVTVLDLSRNFGKEIAMAAGLDHADGDAVVIIDADLQDPPELIPEMLRLWREGYDNVYARRTRREHETWLKKATAHAFYRVIRYFSRVRIPEDTGDFRLLSRRAVLALRRLREQHRFMKGLYAWIGFPAIALPYRREGRAAGRSKWNYWKLWNFALEGITAFSIAPLKVATYFGLCVAGLSFLFALWIVAKTLLIGEPVRGYPTMMVTILFLGGAQLTAIGILGEYVGRMFNETKNRPLYLLSQYLPAPALRNRRQDDDAGGHG